MNSSTPSRSFVSNVPHVVWIETLGVPQLIVIDVGDEPSLSRIRGLGTGFIFLTPTEFRFQQSETHVLVPHK